MVAEAHAAAEARQQGLAPLIGLCALGVAITAFVVAAPWVIRTHGYGVFIPCLLASGAAAVAATILAPVVPARHGLLVVLVFAAAMRLLLVTEEPFLSSDIYRYIWDGRVQGAGINPYLHVPADDALKALRDTQIYPGINRADYAQTAYPPVAQAFFLAVTSLGESLMAMRLAMVACEVAIVVVLIDLLRQLQLPVTAVVAWAWHPLAVWEIANNGHLDALMVALLLIGLWLLVRSRTVASGIFVALAALVKPYALVVLPVMWRPWDWRLPLVIAGTVALCYLPYLGAGAKVVGFVTTGGYLAEEGLVGGDGFWLVALARAALGNAAGLTAIYVVIALGVLACLAGRAAFRATRSIEDVMADTAALLMAGLFFLSPNYPWYFLAAVPFIALGGGAAAWAMTLGAILLYKPLYLPHNDLVWKTLANLPFVLAVAAAVLTRGRIMPERGKALPWTR